MTSSFDVASIRKDFPILREKMNGRSLVYLDNANSTQKPIQVIDSLSEFYRINYSNIHRGVYFLSQQATEKYEHVRSTVQKFIRAKDPNEIVFLRGTTEAINLLAQTFAKARVTKDDEILISHMEHHSNIVPWQILCRQTGARLRVVPINDRGEISIDDFRSHFSSRTKLVSVVHLSNSLGTVNPVKDFVEIAHQKGVPIILDGAQAISHLSINVQELDCDFYVFSGHKVYGPTGIGALYGKKEHLEAMPPYHGGGDMIRSVTFEETLYNDVPHKFEAGTPNIADTIGMEAALHYVDQLGLSKISEYENSLLKYATETLSTIPKLRIVGTAKEKASVLSFVIEGIHPHDIGTILDQEGIAVRAGHHCTQPVMERFGVPATVRASFAFYNTREEIDALADGLQTTIRIFS